MTSLTISDVVVPDDFILHPYGTGEKLPITMPVLQATGNLTERYRIALGFYATGDSAAWTLSPEQFQDFLTIQALTQISPSLLQLLTPQSVIGGRPELTPKQRLLKRILALRDTIQAERGILSESYPLIREDRER